MSKGRSEKVTTLLAAYADEFQSVEEVTDGNIAILSGLKDTTTGDTLLSGLSAGKSALKTFEQEQIKHGDEAVSPFLSGVSVPDPVFYCSIEPPSMAYAKKLETALQNLAREDPSLGVTINEDTGQTVLSGMGELHLEIIQDRIKKEYKVDADLGELMIAYR